MCDTAHTECTLRHYLLSRRGAYVMVVGRSRHSAVPCVGHLAGCAGDPPDLAPIPGRDFRKPWWGRNATEIPAHGRPRRPRSARLARPTDAVLIAARGRRVSRYIAVQLRRGANPAPLPQPALCARLCLCWSLVLVSVPGPLRCLWWWRLWPWLPLQWRLPPPCRWSPPPPPVVAAASRRPHPPLPPPPRRWCVAAATMGPRQRRRPLRPQRRRRLLPPPPPPA